MSPDDKLLFDRWTGRRDAEAFNEMARRYAAMVYHTCARVLRNETDAQDVAQDCFETLATLRKAPSTSLGAYLHAMAFNKSLNRIKSDRRRADRETRYVQNQPPKETDRWDDLYEHVDAAIAGLPARLREPVIAHFLEGKTHEEIARREGVSRPAVTQRIQRGVEQIRERLRKQGIAVGGTVLAALLAENASGAVPAAVLGAIGKLSVAGAAATPVLSFPVVVAVVGCLVTMGGFALHLYGTGLGSPDPSMTRLSSAESPGSLNPLGQSRAPSSVIEEREDVGVGPSESPDPSNSSISSDTATVVGRVVDLNGDPLAGVQVLVRGEMGSGAFGATLSDTDGTYRVEKIVPTREVLIYGRRKDHNLRTAQKFIRDVRAGQQYTCDLIAFDLHAEGRVVDALGRDLRDVQLLAQPIAPYDGGLPSSDLTADGEFDIAGLVPGNWEWKVRFPGEEWHATGETIAVQAGRSLTNVIVRIGEDNGYELTGIIRDPDGNLLPAAYVHASMSVPPYESYSSLTGDDGRFLITGLSAGVYSVLSAHNDFGIASRQRIAVPTSAEIDLQLPPRGGILARIIDQDTGDPVPVFEVLESKQAGGNNPLSVQTNWQRFESPEGIYEASNLFQQQLRLRVRAEGYAPFETTVDLPPGFIRDDVIVPLVRARTLTGRVLDVLGNPVAGAQIFEGDVPESHEMDRMLLGRSGGDGHFELAGLSPWPLVLATYHHAYALSWMEIGADETEVTVRLTQGATVRCAVVATGSTVPDVSVGPKYMRHQRSMVASLSPTGDRKVTLERLVPDEMLMIIASARYAGEYMGRRRQYIPMTLRDGEFADVVFQFAADDTRLEVLVSKDREPQPGLYCSVIYEFSSGVVETIDAHTDQEGRLVLEGIPIGSATLSVMPTGVTDETEAVQLALVIREGLNTAVCAL